MAAVRGNHWFIETLQFEDLRLPWRAPEIGGVDQSCDMVAANAVDLVVSQFHRNETGVPPWPRRLLFPGRWVEPVGAGVC